MNKICKIFGEQMRDKWKKQLSWFILIAIFLLLWIIIRGLIK